MRLLTRYVLAEVLKVFAVALVALTGLLIVVGVVDRARDEGLGPAQVLQVIPFLLPDMLRYSIPATALFAVCSVYGRMSGANEVVAVKALGISPLSLIWPTFVLGFLLSLLSVWLNDVAVTWGQDGIRRVVVNALEEIAYSRLRTHRSFTSRQFAINVQGVEGRKLIYPTFSFLARGNAPALTVMAAEAELIVDPQRKVLKIVFRDGEALADGEISASLDQFEQELPLDKASMNGDNSHLPSRMAIHVIPDEIAKTRRQIADLEARDALDAGTTLLTGDLDRLSTTNWQERAESLAERRSHLDRLRTETPRRWASGFSCLCFVLIGVPMAIRLRNSDFLTSFFLCFLPIVVGYYPLLAFGLEQAKNGVLHPYVVWLGDLVLVGWGAWLLRRVMRY